MGHTSDQAWIWAKSFTLSGNAQTFAKSQHVLMLFRSLSWHFPLEIFTFVCELCFRVPSTFVYLWKPPLVGAKLWNICFLIWPRLSYGLICNYSWQLIYHKIGQWIQSTIVQLWEYLETSSKKRKVHFMSHSGETCWCGYSAPVQGAAGPYMVGSHHHICVPNYNLVFMLCYN
jgi:hypothetical protein